MRYCYPAVTIPCMAVLRQVVTRHQADGVWADVKLSEEWQVSYRLVARGRRPVIAELRVSLREGAVMPSNGLSGAVVRNIRVGALLAHMSQMLSFMWVQPGAEVPRAVAAWAKLFPFLLGEEPRARSAGDSARRRGRKPLSERLLAEAAKAYVDALRRGSRRPVLDAAKRTTQPPERFRDLLHKARVCKPAPFLVGGTSGVAGGRLTPAAKAVLRRSTTKRRSRAAKKG